MKKKKKRLGEIYNSNPNPKTNRKGKGKSCKEFQETIEEGLDISPDCSDFSLSDVDIEHRNSILRNEAETTWEVSSILGVVFDREKEDMIEVFTRMKDEDKRGVGANWYLRVLYGRLLMSMEELLMSSLDHRHKNTTFAFVRYKSSAEMQRAVKGGNNRLIDGWHIKVKRPSFGWKEKRSYNKSLGSKSGEDMMDRGVVSSQRSPTKAEKECSLELSFDLLLLHEEMEWLERCVVGQLRDHSNLRLVHESLNNANINCSICPMGGVTVTIIFYSKVEMEVILSNAKEVLYEWFEDLCPWRQPSGPRKIVVWVKLEGIPLDAWHPEFFMSLAS
ncbi:hypothetical protein DITRI_Ditri15bG0031600 [Diplodiscus trichospermus]